VKILTIVFLLLSGVVAATGGRDGGGAPRHLTVPFPLFAHYFVVLPLHMFRAFFVALLLFIGSTFFALLFTFSCYFATSALVRQNLAICKRHPLRSESSSWFLDKSSSSDEDPAPCGARVEASNLGVRHSLFCHSNWGT